MDVNFAITDAPDITVFFFHYEEPQPEYELADTAYELALAYLEEHPDRTFADIDYDWEILPVD